MRVTQAFRFELDPNREIQIALAQHVGAARFASNWGLARCREAQARGDRIPSATDLHKAWNAWKRPHAPGWVEVSQCAPQEAFRDLERAFRNWRQGRSGRPRFKRKKSLDDNKARLTGSIRVTPRHVQLPRIGKVRTKEQTDQLLDLLQARKARILSATEEESHVHATPSWGTHPAGPGAGFGQPGGRPGRRSHTPGDRTGPSPLLPPRPAPGTGPACP